jgi:hypothetical protein
MAQTSGLPCRGGCNWLLSMTDLAKKDRLAFTILCKSRIDHELADHGYVHEPVNISKAKYDWGASRRFVLPGQGI